MGIDLLYKDHNFWNFYGNGWYISWLTFIIAGVLFPLVMKLCEIFSKKN